jgi:hypothetical protein
MSSNVFNSFWSWLETCLTWFFPETLLQDSFISLIINGLEFVFGVWLLYLLIMKPILMIIRGFDNHIYRG